MCLLFLPEVEGTLSTLQLLSFCRISAATASHHMKLPAGPINVALKPFHILIS